MSRLARARQANAVLSVVLIVLFVLHGMGNSFLIVGVGAPLSKVLARAIVALAVVHGLLGMWVTLATIHANRRGGASYVALNGRFWAVRASGLAIAVLIVFHMLTFLQTGGGAYRLREFGELQLASHMGLVLAMAVHLVCNMRPLAVSLGLPASRSRAYDVAAALAVLLAVMAVAFVIYYLRWSVI